MKEVRTGPIRTPRLDPPSILLTTPLPPTLKQGQKLEVMFTDGILHVPFSESTRKIDLFYTKVASKSLTGVEGFISQSKIAFL